MYINKCTKCGAEFETKNPKRVICPNCLYPDKKPILDSDSQNPEEKQDSEEKSAEKRTSYSSDSGQDKPESNPQRRYDRPQGGYPRNDRNDQGQRNDRPYRPYNNDNRGSYERRPYNNGDRPQYNDRPRPYGDRPQYGDRPRPYGDRPQQYGDRPPQRPPYPNRDNRQGGYQGGPPQRPPYNRDNRQGGFRRPQAPRQLLVDREQLAQIEILYKKSLPLPNPDIHEVIGTAIELEPRKVFFGINLIRQKMMLPKLPFPKRKLAVSSDQLMAIKSLYEPLLPLPPIGCHKILAAQLKMDEWRVHVGIGLVRKQMGLDRWNPDRPDAPEEFKKK